MNPDLEIVVRNMIDARIADDAHVAENRIFECIGKHIDYMTAKLGWLSEAEMEDFYDALRDD